MTKYCKALVAAFVLLYSATALAFNCGPHTLTYVVAKPDGAPAGIRCVKLLFSGVDHGMLTYQLHWYGEGNWGNKGYRHVGFAAQDHAIHNPGGGAAADIYGNGEAFKGGKVNLRVSITEASQAPSEIHVGGAWNETWKLTQNVDYKPLPDPKVCGANFETYEVRAAGGGGPVMGVRCVISDPGSNSSYWYGAGNWGGWTYKHLGFAWPLHGLRPGPAAVRSGQASDLCDSTIGQSCNTFPDRSIKFTPTSDNKGFNVTGAWNEYWHKPQRPAPPRHQEPPICARKPYLPQCNP